MIRIKPFPLAERKAQQAKGDKGRFVKCHWKPCSNYGTYEVLDSIGGFAEMSALFCNRHIAASKKMNEIVFSKENLAKVERRKRAEQSAIKKISRLF